MNKEKRIWIALFLVLTLMVILSGCSGVAKTALLSISFDPNPVPYDSTDGKWHYKINISESNGVGVTVSSFRFDSYNQEEELTVSYYHYYDDFIVGFETDYVPPFSSIQANLIHTGSTTKYTIITVDGTDDNNNFVEATGRVDYLPQ